MEFTAAPQEDIAPNFAERPRKAIWGGLVRHSGYKRKVPESPLWLKEKTGFQELSLGTNKTEVKCVLCLLE